jgi:adenylate kinase family enzyme
MPVIEYYRTMGLLIDIDGTQSREDVTRTILDDLARRASI